MKTALIFFFLSLNLFGFSQKKIDYSLSEELQNLVDSVPQNLNTDGVSFVMNEFYVPAVKGYQKIKELAGKKDIEVLINHPRSIIQQIGIQITYERDLESFQFQLSVDSLTELVKSFSQKYPNKFLKDDFIRSGYGAKDYLKLKRSLSIEDARILLNHPSLSVRSSAVRILAAKKDFDTLLDFFPKVLNNKEGVVTQDGCVVGFYLFGDLVVKLIKSEQKKSSSDKLDSLRFYEKNILYSSVKMLEKLNPEEKHLERLEEMVFKEKNIQAIIPLLKFKNPEHIRPVMEVIEEAFFQSVWLNYLRNIYPMNRPNAIGANIFKWISENYLHDAFLPYLKEIHHQLLLFPKEQGKKYNRWMISAFYNLIAKYEPKNVYEIITDAKAFKIIDEKEFNRLIENNFNPIYADFIFENWEKTGIVNTTLLNNLLSIDTMRCYKLVKEELNAQLNGIVYFGKRCSSTKMSNLFSVFQKVNQDESKFFYKQALLSKNNCLIRGLGYSLWIKNSEDLIPDIIKKIRLENDFETVRALFITLKKYRLETKIEEAKNIIRRKNTMLSKGKEIPKNEHQRILNELLKD